MLGVVILPMHGIDFYSLSMDAMQRKTIFAASILKQ